MGISILKKCLSTRTSSILTAVIIFIILPAFVIAEISTLVPQFLRFLEWTAAIAFLLTSIGIAIEARAASFKMKAPKIQKQPPSLTIIVAAYLPNEQEIIEQTLLHIMRELDVWSHQLQIILAYNTPSALEIEKILQLLGQASAQILPLRVEGSTSKAENIMAALPYITGEMTALLDADHHPHGDAPAKAWRWLLNGYDIVQGRCIIRHSKKHWQTRMIAVEFEQMYGVTHQGRSSLVDTAIFGGTNGWWRTSALKAIGMDRRMLTEDIDSATRALLAGYRIIHDRSVISTELPPLTIRAWWGQRMRWAQGWREVGIRRSHLLAKTDQLTTAQKNYWKYMLVWGAIFPIFFCGSIAVFIAALLIGHSFKLLTDPFLVFTTLVTIAVLIYRNVCTWRVTLPETRQSLGRRDIVLYIILSPFYELLKSLVSLIASLREIAGIDEWVVTSRTAKMPKISQLNRTRETSLAN